MSARLGFLSPRPGGWTPSRSDKPVRTSPNAERDLDLNCDYVSGENREAAARIRWKIRQTADVLAFASFGVGNRRPSVPKIFQVRKIWDAWDWFK